jgi:hypothetical protein
MSSFSQRTFAATALMGVAFLLPTTSPADPEATISSRPDSKSAQAIPWSEVGTRAGAQYQGDGLAIFPFEHGAILRCVFQKLEGEATAEGLWLRSTVADIVKDQFRILASAVGRNANTGRESSPLPAEVRGQTSSGAYGVARFATQLPQTGTVQVASNLVRFIRPVLIEEYSVSMDGVRQDFVIPNRPEGSGELQVRLDVSGALVEASPDGVQLVLVNCGRRIAYSRLRVTDASGTELRARMEVQSNSAHRTPHSELSLAVVVNDAAAAYPIRIDPTFSDAHWISMSGFPGANSTVRAVAVDEAGNLYAGGDFTIVGDIRASRIAKWNGSSWSALGSGMNSSVFALAVAGGDLYAGGAFTNAGGITANRIAKWNGSSWSALDSGFNHTVLALSVSGTDLYAGGIFTNAGGISANRIARWNGSSWSALGSGMNNSVYTLAIASTNLYAGGVFTTAGGNAANRIARWNGSSWSALGSGMNNSVYTLTIASTNLYAGGVFTTAGGNAANRIARWNGSSWSALSAGLNNTVWAVAVSGSNLYAGGEFSGPGANYYVAKWNGSSWSNLGSGMNSAVFALALSGPNLYGGGNFTAPAANIAKWSGSIWSALGSGLNNQVMALAVADTNLYAGGYFTATGGNRISRWNGSGWSGLGAGISHDNLSFPSVRALALSGSNLYAGGQFTKAGGNAATNIAKWNGNSWSPLGSGIGFGFPDAVSALAVLDQDLYAGGSFTNVGGNAVVNIAKWNGTNWSSLGSGVYLTNFWGGVGGAVNAVAVSGSNLYVGGDFTTAGSSPANFIAKWDGHSWSPLGSGMNQRVSALAVWGNDLYAAGDFTNAGGIQANYVAKWNGNNWSSMGLGLNYSVYALAVSGSNLYAGGGGIAANFIAKWDGNSWSSMGSGMNNSVYALAMTDRDLYAGGLFTTAGGKVSAYVAKGELILPASALPSPFLTGGDFVAQFDGTPGVAYTIEYTDNVSPANWQRATTITAPSTDQGLGVGVFEFRDNSAGAPQRFYRSVYPSY